TRRPLQGSNAEPSAMTSTAAAAMLRDVSTPGWARRAPNNRSRPLPQNERHARRPGACFHGGEPANAELGLHLCALPPMAATPGQPERCERGANRVSRGQIEADHKIPPDDNATARRSSAARATARVRNGAGSQVSV